MRLLPCVRLSIETDESTSPERQLDKIQTFARLGDHELLPITERDYDLNVSGSVSPFERPGLGPWLQDDRLDMWDGIIVAKLDRLTRSLFDFVTLVSWLEARGKTLVCIDPMLDLSTPSGRAFASITAAFAQFERETIAARVRDAWHKLRDGGKYGGGQVPFGYRPAKLDKGWGYEPDPEYGPIVAEIFHRYARYESLGSITRWLNETQVPTPWNVTRIRNGKPVKDTLWKATSVRKILGSRAAIGATVLTDGTPVRDEEGMIVYRADALVSLDVWERVQARLASNPVAPKINSWPLTGIAFCAACGGPMYASTSKYGGKEYRYLCCVHSLRRDGICTARRVGADDLEAAVGRELLALIGNRELTENKLTPGRDYSTEIAKVAEEIGHLFSKIQVDALSGKDVREDQATLARAQEELTRLHNLKPVQARMEPRSTGQTFRQRWESLDVSGRNEFLRSNTVRALVSREAMPPIERQDGPLTPLETPRMAIIDQPELHAVVYLGTLGGLLGRADCMAATVRPA
jgi:DNA invertase Pin-like site-specific DNA recombinase